MYKSFRMQNYVTILIEIIKSSSWSREAERRHDPKKTGGGGAEQNERQDNL